MVKQWASRAARLVTASAPFAAAVAAMERTARERPNLLRVLTYHRVDEPEHNPDLHPGLLSATPAAFERQLNFLARHYRVIPMEEALAARRSGRELPLRALLITFDDAYQDFADHAWPLLRREGLPVTLFVPTGYPDQPERSFWWDRLWNAVNTTARTNPLATPMGALSLTPARRYATFRRLRDCIKSLPHEAAMVEVERLCAEMAVPPPPSRVLGWEALCRLAAEGVTLAPHTREHPLMNRIAPEAAAEEARRSLHDLEREIGPTLPVFAYPSGGVSPAAVEALASAGIELAFTTERGINDLRAARWLELRRVGVGPSTTLPLLRAQLLPWPTIGTGKAAGHQLREGVGKPEEQRA